MIQTETNTRVIRTKDAEIFETMVTTLRNSGYHIEESGIELLESPNTIKMEDTLNEAIREGSSAEQFASFLSFIPKRMDQGANKDWYWWAILTKKSMFRGK